MIDEYSIRTAICCEDISLIENYEQAINDKINKYVCHHRLEIDENKSSQQLKDEGRYYHRPASELIFLTYSDHWDIHHPGQRKKDKSTKKILINNGKYYEIIYEDNIYEFNTQSEAAKALGVTPTYINRLCAGKATIDGLTVTKKYRIK